MEKDLIAEISARSDTFSKSHKKIADYIVKHYDKAAFITASKLGKVVGVSESTVVRFAVELGFGGYPKLQKALRELIPVSYTHLDVYKRQGLMRKLASGVYSYLPMGLKTLRKVENIIREEMNREDAVELIMSALLPAESYSCLLYTSRCV